MLCIGEGQRSPCEVHGRQEILSLCLRAWMLLLPKRNDTFQKRCSANRGASCQPTDLHVCVSARVNHAYSIILFFQPWPTNLFLKKKKGGRAVKSIFTPSNLNRVLPIWTLLCPVEIHGNIPRRLGWVGTEWEGAHCRAQCRETLSLQLIREPEPDKMFKHVPNFRRLFVPVTPVSRLSSPC